MNCLICKHGETHAGNVTVTLQRDETTVIIKDVPGEVCENCGEYDLSETVTGQVLEIAEEAAERHAEIEVIRFAA